MFGNDWRWNSFIFHLYSLSIIFFTFILPVFSSSLKVVSGETPIQRWVEICLLVSKSTYKHVRREEMENAELEYILQDNFCVIIVFYFPQLQLLLLETYMVMLLVFLLLLLLRC